MKDLKRINLVILGMITGICTLPAVAFALSSSAPARQWTWQECLQAMENNNLELRSEVATLEASIASEKAAWAGFYPTLTGSLSNTTTTQTASNSSSSAATASLSLTENLFSGFQDVGKVKQAEANLLSAQIKLKNLRNRLSADLKTTFARLSFAQSQIELAESILKIRLSNLREVELRFESGRENKGSVLLSAANAEQAKLDKMAAEQLVVSSQRDLARLLGEERAEEIWIKDSPPRLSLQEKIEVENLPDVQAAEAQLKLSAANLQISESNFWPSLKLIASTANSGGSFWPNSNQVALTASLSYDFFSGGKDYQTQKSYKQLQLASELNLSFSKKQALDKALLALADLREAEQKVTVEKAFLDAEYLREKIAHEKYNNGILAFDEWDRLENEYITRRKTFLISTRDLLITEAQSEQTLGRSYLK